MHQINRVLRVMRAFTGLSQAMMSKRLGISRTHYSSMETGSVIPGTGVLNKISKSLGISKEAITLLNLSVPKELGSEYKDMFYKIQEYLAAKLVAGKWKNNEH